MFKAGERITVRIPKTIPGDVLEKLNYYYSMYGDKGLTIYSLALVGTGVFESGKPIQQVDTKTPVEDGLEDKQKKNSLVNMEFQDEEDDPFLV